jgi:hypothetical protein|tara:strand:- start:153 stop:1064 length:912 start_codon:yes stop_codon:yes gene_type:complete
MGLINQTDEQYYLGPDNVWNSWDEDYGNYQFTSIKDIINNFIISYVGEEKIIPKAKRTDVAFHAQRGIQEFSFDILPSVKSAEIEVGPNLNFVLPKDYVNYVKLVWVDSSGIERVIYPAQHTSNPFPILQDNNYEYLFDEQDQEIISAQSSETKKRFQSTTNSEIGNESDNITNRGFSINHFGRRYGISPQQAQTNGVFYIDQLQGIIFFDSSFVGRIVTLKYISDGLGTDEEMVVHKFAEEALYKYMAYAILSTRANTPEYLVSRFKREQSAAKRNAKIRLSNIKIEEITQVMRNKSKIIKH